MNSMNKPLMPAVTVNGEEIAVADIAAEAQNHEAPAGKPGLAWKAAARALVVRSLLQAEARNRNLNAEPLETEPGRFETRDEAEIRELLDQAVEPDTPSDAAVEAVYTADPERFRAPSLFEPAHILFAANPKDADGTKDAFQKALAALATLGEKPGEFARLAAELSDCQSAQAGGQLGQLSSGDTVPEFERVLDTLAPGELHPEPVQTRYGVHIVRLDAVARGEVLPLASVAPQIREALEKAAWTNAARRFTAGLIHDADIQGVDFGTLAA